MSNLNFNIINVKYLIGLIIVLELLLNISVFLVDSNDYSVFYLTFLILILFYVLYCLKGEFPNFIEEYTSFRSFSLKTYLFMYLFFSIILAIQFVLYTYNFDNYIFNNLNLFNLYNVLLVQLDFPMNFISIHVPLEVSVIADVLTSILETILLFLVFMGISLSKLEKIGKLPSFIITAGLIFIFPFNDCFLMFLIFILTYCVYYKLNNLFMVFYLGFILNLWNIMVDSLNLVGTLDPIIIFVLVSFSVLILINVFLNESFWNET